MIVNNNKELQAPFSSSVLKLANNSTHGDDFLLVIIIIILFGTFN